MLQSQHSYVYPCLLPSHLFALSFRPISLSYLLALPLCPLSLAYVYSPVSLLYKLLIHFLIERQAMEGR